MYIVTIYNGGVPTVIHGARCKLPEAKVTRERNAIGAFDFEILPGNPGWGLLSPFSTLVEVADMRDGSLAFEGRVIAPAPAMESGGSVRRSVTCEHVEGYLLDSTQTYQAEREWAGNGEFLTRLLDVHNGKLPEEKRVYLGSVSDGDSFTRGVNRGKTWDNIKSFADDRGAEFRVRRSNGALYLDFGLKIGTTRATPIKLGRNMKTARREVNPNAVITRLYPYGSKITVQQTDANGETTDVQTEERVGIESVNDGKGYIEDAVAIEAYGIIEGEEFWDDIDDPLELMQAGAKWLGNNNKMPVSTSIDALDLSLLGIDPDSFELLDWYPCKNPLIDLDDDLEIVKHVLDVCEPSASTFEMGETTALVSKDIASLGGLNQKIEVVKDQLSTKVVNVGNAVTATRAEIKTAEDRIMLEVEESVNVVYELTETNSTQITQLMQTSDEFSFNFSTLETSVSELNGVVATEQEERLKYIKFIDGEIWLGKDPDDGEDDFKLRISNQRISFLLNNVEVAYFADDALHVETAYLYRAYITKGLYIGGLLIEESSDGNVNARWVG